MLSVVLYHAWPTWFVGGFIGVDIFFVISGYLITSIILIQLQAGTFSIIDFYSRRVRRIFPALLLVLVATLGFGWMVLLSGEFQQIGKHTAAGGGFISNLVLWYESGYFDNSANTKPLLHLWSLGVEEQFYFVWPLVLWLVFSKRLNFLYVAAVIFCMSMLANVLTVESNPTAAFFSPATRFWELMSGGVAAYLHLRRAPWGEGARTVASVGGAALLVAGFALIKPQYMFPGWWAILPVAGVFLLIMAGPRAFFNRRLLSLKPMVWVGLISYPFYLWHWPLLSYGFIIYGDKPTYQIKLTLVLAAFALAYATYRWLESPLRGGRNKTRIVATLSTGMATLAALGILINAGVIRERIDVHGADVYLNALNDSDFPGKSFEPFHHHGIVFQKIESRAPGLTVFLGDSLIQQYGPRIEQQLGASPERYSSVIFATAGGCPPILHTIKLPRIRFPLCVQTVEAAFDLANQPEVDVVVIGAAWYGYFKHNNNELLFDTGSTRQAFPAPEAMESAYTSLKSSVELLKRNGKRVYIVLQPPSGGAFDPRNMYQGSRFDGIRPLEKIENVSLDKFFQDNREPRLRLMKIASETGALIIEPAATLCPGKVCAVLDAEGEPVYTDPIHMRPKFSRLAAGYLDQTLAPSPAPKS